MELQDDPHGAVHHHGGGRRESKCLVRREEKGWGGEGMVGRRGMYKGGEGWAGEERGGMVGGRGGGGEGVRALAQVLCT